MPPERSSPKPKTTDEVQMAVMNRAVETNPAHHHHHHREQPGLQLPRRTRRNMPQRQENTRCELTTPTTWPQPPGVAGSRHSPEPNKPSKIFMGLAVRPRVDETGCVVR
jgi:hypothetical protein